MPVASPTWGEKPSCSEWGSSAAITDAMCCCRHSAAIPVARWWRSREAMPRAPRSWRGRPTWRTVSGIGARWCEEESVAAVAVAVPPVLQPAVACRALELGKPVFVEKPLAADLAGAGAMLASAQRSALPTIIDFNFPELPAWRTAKAILDSGRLGRLRHVVAAWNTESHAVRLGLTSWKTAAENGGGVLGNFVSHCFHNLEWFCGPICGLGGSPAQPARQQRAGERRAGAGVCLGRRRQPADELRVLSRIGTAHRVLWRGRHAGSGQPDHRLFPQFHADAGGARR